MNDPTVKVPGIGPVKRNYLIAGGVLVALVGIYWWRQRSASSASSASSTDATQAETDPATGYPTGSAEDIAALQQQAAQTSAADAAGTGGTSGGSSTPPDATGYSTNGAWSQSVQSYLVNNAGADPSAVSAALGAYIAGSDVTEAQKSIVEQGIAFAGYPPVAGAGGYPPSIRQAPTVVVPPTTVPLLKAPGNVHALSATKNSVLVTWNGVPTARYYLYANGHKSALLSGTTWEVNQAHTGIAMKAGTAYSIQVSSVNTVGKEGPKSGTVTVHTSK